MKLNFKKFLAVACAVSLIGGTSGISSLSDVLQNTASAFNASAATATESFLTNGYDTRYMTVYDGSSALNNFAMNGRTYYQGLMFTGSDRYSYATFSTAEIDTISFTLGHIDNTVLGNATLTIYLDGVAEEIFSLTPLMELQEYTLDVSNAAAVQFYFDFDSYNSNSYALADLTVDGEALTSSYSAPEYDSSEDFLKASFNSRYLTVYDGSTKTSSFNMNGRTYYQGLVFAGSDRYTYAQFNTENVDTLSFTLGHIDNTKLQSATMTIYLDGVAEDEIALSSLMSLRDYTLDVSEASVVRFYLDCDGYNNNSYALANLSVDGKPVAMEHVTPTYSSSEKFLQSSFNSYYLTVYDGSTKTSSFNMNGRTYYQGLVFTGSDRYTYAQFNTENVDTLSFTLGHIDNTKLQSATMTIYLDGIATDEIALSSLMNLRDYTLDVSEASVVRFYLDCDGYNNNSYALANLIVDGKPVAMEHVVPEFEAPEELLNSAFNTYYLTVYDGSTKTSSFNMNGRTYYQGLVFTGSDRYAYAQFNTENVDTLSFTMGHVDDTKLGTGMMSIYLDGVLEDEVALAHNMNLTNYTLDVSGASMVRIYVDCNGYNNNAYGLGDICMDGTPSVFPRVIPAYSSAEEWLDDSFNTYYATIYDGSDITARFDVNSETYYQGIVLKSSDRYAYAKFNTEKLSNVTFKIGHVDGTKSADGTLTIIADDVEIDQIALTSNMTPVEYSLDVTDVSTVRFYFDGSGYNDNSYALFDVKTTERNSKGDVDLDGKVTIADVVLHARFVAQDDALEAPSAEAIKNADVNGDGVYDADDTAKLGLYLAGLETL
ncbi:MAG: hypothetical protein E7501_01360 [Ruminococcus sp.]|nr:hypothetical protein [Ruminococcus sp.]